MSSQAEEFTIGVEEEYQIINPTTRELSSRVEHVLPKAQKALGLEVQPEAQRSQIEIGTPICRTLADVRSELVRLRREVIAAAAKDGNQIAAAGTHPFSHWEQQQLTPKERYQTLMEDYQQLTRELVIFGCHVHVGISDRSTAISVMNRARVWLSPLLALAASSPFWLGKDTGYASYRTEIWGRWPLSGVPLIFESLADYEALVQVLVETKSLAEATKIYWDVRLSERFPTIEFRVTDVCQTVDEAVMVAGLVRALARTCYQQAMSDKPFPAARHELVRVAHWRAARYGLDEDLIDFTTMRAVPARELVENFLTFVRPSLEEYGEWDEVSSLVQQTMQFGNGATRQRDVYKRTGSLENVVDLIVQDTAKGIASV
ncbi:carboxylate-amine ligase [Nostoc sp. 'Peltigera malacea cyanobiont' DB3992]|uniref:carboxylate-amine ligase n=1 Tax=Nostoc sp. 'Peltigera malacea cyanobiont' DB3992 TaxID=1206980 RepID=UPI000C04B818|nr:carboxylate-amine ligase [Nostoc sp. 'Peltigera malacea cyanobiont' DB3992]PHM10142.1 carboxylate-amine ligase [Nostoc sp. 'Peltigera malacea cyanobiont' DB3992]